LNLLLVQFSGCLGFQSYIHMYVHTYQMLHTYVHVFPTLATQIVTNSRTHFFVEFYSTCWEGEALAVGMAV